MTCLYVFVLVLFLCWNIIMLKTTTTDRPDEFIFGTVLDLFDLFHLVELFY